MADIHQDKILILDFGSQYTQLIARRIREIGVYCELFAGDVEFQQIADFNPKGIILSGGPESAGHAHSPMVASDIFDMHIPILGVCYGMQMIAAHFGTAIDTNSHSEFGYAEVRAHNHSKLLKGIQDRQNDQGHGLLDVWMSHGDRVSEIPGQFQLIASSANAPIAGIADESRHLYGLQFHPEVTHTHQGTNIYSRFVRDICGCASLWTAENIVDDAIASVRQQVGDEHVILGLSGGVDSSVVAAILHRAIGEQLTCVFVDNGLLRLNEGDQVMATFARQKGIRIIRVDAEQRFLDALKGVAEPEQKRKIIGNLFVQCFEEASKKLTNAQWLAQGTIYPDVIESAGAKTGKAHLIKSHHNVGGLPANMKLKLIEPLHELFKDEVRKIGVQLGLDTDRIYRHPFPGPGLGVRIVGEIKKVYTDTLRLADDIFIGELRKHELYDTVSQAFAVFLPVKSVGVTGDGRRYEYVIALRAVETTDFMTARWARLPYDFLDHVSRRIINEIPTISRVTYDISGKPPATIEWE